MLLLPERELVLETSYTEKEIFDRLRPHVRRERENRKILSAFTDKYFVGTLLHNSFRLTRPVSLNKYLVPEIQGDVKAYLSKSRVHITFSYSSTVQVILGIIVAVVLGVFIFLSFGMGDDPVNERVVWGWLLMFFYIYAMAMSSFLLDYYIGRKRLMEILGAKVIDPELRAF